MGIKQEAQAIFQAAQFNLFRVKPGTRADDLFKEFATSRNKWVKLGGREGMAPDEQVELIANTVSNSVLRVADQVAGQAVTQNAYEPNFSIAAALDAAGNLGTEQKVEILDGISARLIAKIAYLHQRNKTPGKESGQFDRIQVLTAAIVALHTDSPLAEKIKEDTEQLGIKADQGTGATERNLFKRIVANLEPMAGALGTYLSTPEVTNGRVADVAWLTKGELQGLFAAKMLGYANIYPQRRFIQQGVLDPSLIEDFGKAFGVANEFHRLREASGKLHVWELMIRLMQINPRLAAAFAAMVDPSFVENRMGLKAQAQGVPMAGSRFGAENELYDYARTGAIDFRSVVDIRLAGGRFANIPAMLTDFFCGRDNYEAIIGHTTSARARWMLRQMFDEKGVGVLFYPPLAADEATLARVAADVNVDTLVSSEKPDPTQIELARSLSTITRMPDYGKDKILPETRQAGVRYSNDIIAEQADVATAFAQASRIFLADRLNSLRDHLGERDMTEAKRGSYYGATMIMMALALQEGMFPNPKAVEGLHQDFGKMIIEVVGGLREASTQVKQAAEFTLQALVPLFPKQEVITLIKTYRENALIDSKLLGSFAKIATSLSIKTDVTLPAAKGDEANGVRREYAEAFGEMAIDIVGNYSRWTKGGNIASDILDGRTDYECALGMTDADLAAGHLDGATAITQADLFARTLHLKGVLIDGKDAHVVLRRKLDPAVRTILYDEMMPTLPMGSLRDQVIAYQMAKRRVERISSTVDELRGVIAQAYPRLADVINGDELRGPDVAKTVEELAALQRGFGIESMVPQLPADLLASLSEARKAVTTWEERMQQLGQVPDYKARIDLILGGVTEMLNATYGNLPQTHLAGGGFGRSMLALNFPNPIDYPAFIRELYESGSKETREFLDYLEKTGELGNERARNGIATIALDALKLRAKGAIEITGGIVDAEVDISKEKLRQLRTVLEYLKQNAWTTAELFDATLYEYQQRAIMRTVQQRQDASAGKNDWQDQIALTNRTRSGAIAEVNTAYEAAVREREELRLAIQKQIGRGSIFDARRTLIVSTLNGICIDNTEAAVRWIPNADLPRILEMVGSATGVDIESMSLREIP